MAALILPDGKILVGGGGASESKATHPAEIFDPAAEQWTVTGAMKADFRLYHSTTVLLPDGGAMWLGGTIPWRIRGSVVRYWHPDIEKREKRDWQSDHWRC